MKLMQVFSLRLAQGDNHGRIVGVGRSAVPCRNPVSCRNIGSTKACPRVTLTQHNN